MNNWYIWDEIYHNVLQEINTLVDVEDQKEIATYVVNDLIKRFDIWNNISDWYHTFGELYKHRIHLFIALCSQVQKLKCLKNDYYEHRKYKDYKLIKSKKHFDWSKYEWWFIVQLETDLWQISYHLPEEYWYKCNFIKTKDKANEWDWHDSNTVLERLLLI